METVTRGKEIHAHPPYPERLHPERKEKQRSPCRAGEEPTENKKIGSLSSNG